MDETIENKCCCCGGEVRAIYKKGDSVSRAYAETCDVCVECFRAGCQVMTGKKCNITGKQQVQLAALQKGE